MTGAPPQAGMTDAEAEELFHQAQRALQLNHWSDARSMFHQLALRVPHETKYRALMALARGHEAASAGDMQKAHEEWRRALVLDPKLEDARIALRTRRRRTSIIDRLLGRSN